MQNIREHKLFLELVISDANESSIEKMSSEFTYQPTTLHRTGETLGKSLLKYKENVIVVSSGLSEYEFDFDKHAERIVDVLVLHQAELKALVQKNKVRLCCAVYFSYSSGESYPSPTLKPPLLKLLADLGIPFVFDPYVMP